jgi:hypothetical protein
LSAAPLGRGLSLDAIGDTKTRRRRTVRLLAPLAADLAEWRMQCGRPADDALVFAGHDGGPWRRTRRAT